MLIKLWNWEKNWTCQQVFEGHTHYVMQIVINPKDNNTFASASLDRTLKVNLIVFRNFAKKLHDLFDRNADLYFRYGNWDRVVRISLWKVTKKE